MRIFLGGSKGLVLYEDEELTQLHSDPLLSAVRANPGRLVAGTESGSIVVYDGNGEARVTAKDLGKGVQGLAVGADGTLFAGLIPAAMWVSTDQGETWDELDGFANAPHNENWTAPWGTPLVSTISTHPKDPGTVFAGVEVGGIYRSRDAGKSWFDVGIPVDDIHSVQVCPAKPERVYVSTGEGCFCSDDEGFGWRQMGTSNKRQYTMGLAAHPSEADRVIISAAQGPPPTWSGPEGARCDIYLSTDAGRRFRTVVRGLAGGVHRKALVINSKVPSEIVFGTSTGQLFYSNDGGETFDEEATDLGNLKTIVFA
ncbi:MAG TPA: hypothetical protein VHL54_07705 [Actinomycetota bacterium]|nr:hypothetical protein [Actinomycetota bacterium]